MELQKIEITDLISFMNVVDRHFMKSTKLPLKKRKAYADEVKALVKQAHDLGRNGKIMIELEM